VPLFFGAQRSRGMARPGEKTATSASASRCGHQAAGRLTSIMRGSVGRSAGRKGDEAQSRYLSNRQAHFLVRALTRR